MVFAFWAIIGVIALLLVKQPHLSATVIIGVTGIVMIFLGSANLAWLISMGVAGVTRLRGAGSPVAPRHGPCQGLAGPIQRFPGRRLAGPNR